MTGFWFEYNLQIMEISYKAFLLSFMQSCVNPVAIWGFCRFLSCLTLIFFLKSSSHRSWGTIIELSILLLSVVSQRRDASVTQRLPDRRIVLPQAVCLGTKNGKVFYGLFLYLLLICEEFRYSLQLPHLNTEASKPRIVKWWFCRLKEVGCMKQHQKGCCFTELPNQRKWDQHEDSHSLQVGFLDVSHRHSTLCHSLNVNGLKRASV